MIRGKKNISWNFKALYNPYVINFPILTKELEHLQLKRENKNLNSSGEKQCPKSIISNEIPSHKCYEKKEEHSLH